MAQGIIDPQLYHQMILEHKFYICRVLGDRPLQ